MNKPVPLIYRRLGGFVALAVLLLAGARPAAAQDGGVAADVVEFQRLMEQYVTLPPVPEESRLLADWRQKTITKVDELIAGLQALSNRTGKPADVMLVLALCHAKRAGVLLDERRDLDAEYNGELNAGKTRESVVRDRADLVARRADLAERVAAEYRDVDAVLSEGLASAEALKGDREATQLNLITGVVLAQSAIVQDAAIDAMQDAGRRPSINPALFREILDRSAALLSEYLSKTPRENGLEWVRGQYYLGVVSYRRSLMLRVQGEEYFTRVDMADAGAKASYSSARQIFDSLADAEALTKILKPEGPTSERAAAAFQSSTFVLRNRFDESAVARYYAASANLYLGLMTAIDPALAEKPVERLEAAQRFLALAVSLDQSVPNQREQEVISLTSGTIKLSTEKVVRELEEATKASEAKPINDFSISWGIGYVYDSNVTLLGRNTEAPLDKQRKRDSRIPALMHIGYTADLDAYAPNDPFLRRIQIFVEGRTSATWNARITDFNEQMYGATVNARYELVGPGAIQNLDGAYLNWRYDYDYVLLGNDGFLRLNRLRPSLDMVMFDSVFQPSFHFVFEDRNYLEELTDERFDRDGNYIAGGFDLRFDLGKWVDADRLWQRDAWGSAAPKKDDPAWRRPLELNVGLDFTSNSTQGDEFDYDSAILTAGARLPLPFGMDFFYSTIFEWQDYWQNSRVDRNRLAREDFIQEHGFRLERKFFLTDYPKDYENAKPLQLDRLVMTLFGDIRFTIDDSNVRDRLGQSVFEYNRIWYGAGVRFDLN